ncbi:MAG: RNA 2',3'-cyclic phosphodiesterase [Gammaproteobacteria bacterium]
MKRLFFALWPDDAIRESCKNLVRELALKEGRAVYLRNLHVTLAFLGNVDTKTEISLTEEAGKITAPNMNIVFDKLEFWRKPGILCLSASQADAATESLAGALLEIAVRLNIPVDTRPFVPHVTLFRKVKRPLQREIEPIVWQADTFCLVQSQSILNEVEYEIVQSW